MITHIKTPLRWRSPCRTSSVWHCVWRSPCPPLFRYYPDHCTKHW